MLKIYIPDPDKFFPPLSTVHRGDVQVRGPGAGGLFVGGGSEKDEKGKKERTGCLPHAADGWEGCPAPRSSVCVYQWTLQHWLLLGDLL